MTARRQIVAVWWLTRAGSPSMVAACESVAEASTWARAMKGAYTIRGLPARLWIAMLDEPAHARGQWRTA